MDDEKDVLRFLTNSQKLNSALFALISRNEISPIEAGVDALLSAYLNDQNKLIKLLEEHPSLISALDSTLPSTPKFKNLLGFKDILFQKSRKKAAKSRPSAAWITDSDFQPDLSDDEDSKKIGNDWELVESKKPSKMRIIGSYDI
jgi:hypothetical protein